MTDLDADVVVIGSGFGGAVAALRAAEKGYRVVVLEAGRRFADDELPETSWQLSRYLWAPAIGWFGIQRIHWLRHVLVLAGAGVGGGSLNYANTLYQPPATFFANGTWAEITDWRSELADHYDQARRMLGVVTNPCDGPVERLMAATAADLGVADTLEVTPVGVLFGAEPGAPVPDPYFGGVGPARRTCTECGACMTGCRVGAKNTLTKNYLALAERAGVQIRSLRTVVDVRPEGDVGYRVVHARTGPVWRGPDRQVITAGQVVVAAGAWGSQRLLLGCRDSGSLPRLSPSLGRYTRTNSEALVGAVLPRFDPDVDTSKGIAITRSFHPDADTHVENCRYGAGSNAMGLLGTLLVDGRPADAHGSAGSARRRTRLAGFVRQVARRPGDLASSLDLRRWSERSIIGLVMQSRDNSLTLSGRLRPAWLRRLGALTVSLRSADGHGESNPHWIPAGHKAIRALTDRLGDLAGQRAIPSGTVGDILDVPMTAHFLGGCPISATPADGVVDAYHRVHGYPGISIVDGSTISANLGVNPSLTITAQAERAMSLWPNQNESDPRPPQGQPYVRTPRVWPQRPVVPPGAPGELRRAGLHGFVAGTDQASSD